MSIWETACLRIKLHKLKQPSIKHIYEAQIKQMNFNLESQRSQAKQNFTKENRILIQQVKMQ